MIVVKEPRINRVLFENIKIGECFEFNNKLYIKTKRMGNREGWISCVCLEDGKYYNIYDTAMVVTIPEAKVVY